VLDGPVDVQRIHELAADPKARLDGVHLDEATDVELAGLSLVHLARLLPAIVSVPVDRVASGALAAAIAEGRVLEAEAGEAREFAEVARASVVRVSEAPVPLSEAEHSKFTLFRESFGLAEHVAIQVGDPADWPDPVPVRLHSACLTGDLFGSLRCDCGEQLRGSMSLFAARGGGVLLYLAQEGRGIGLGNKFRAYTLQETGLDTIDADGTLGFGADEREYDVAIQILKELGIERVELLTNNPEKVQALEAAGIRVAHRRPLHGRLNRHNLPYVQAKVNRAGHWLRDMLSESLAGD
jgi:GTP cyclohydrolase II